MKALLIVDVQNDFCPGGALAINAGDRIIPQINRLRTGFPIVALTQDWHPANHKSFASNHPGKKAGDTVFLNGATQILWPDHCIQGTAGARFHPALDRHEGDPIFQKGTDPEIDSYSAFYDNAHRKSTGLGDFFHGEGVTEIFVCGLATDYCVLFSVLDALGEGFQVNVVENACRGVELQPGDSERAIRQMETQGARIVGS